MTEFLPFLLPMHGTTSSHRQQPVNQRCAHPCSHDNNVTRSCMSWTQHRLQLQISIQTQTELCQCSCANQTSLRLSLFSAHLPNRSRNEHVLTLDLGNASKENSCQRLHCEWTLCAKGVPCLTRSWKAGWRLKWGQTKSSLPQVPSLKKATHWHKGQGSHLQPPPA